MRRIKTQEEVERGKKRNQLIIGFLLVFVILGGIVGWGFSSRRDDSSEGSSVKYGDFKFVRTQGYWAIQINGDVFHFEYLPSEVENVSISGFYSLDNYKEKTLYFVNFNPASQSILVNFKDLIGRYQEACLEGLNCTGNIPTKTCEDNVIIFDSRQINGEALTQVYQDNNCVYISGDFTKGADAFMYRALGIL